MSLVDDLTNAMKLASICGLGQFAHSPLTSVLTHFRPEVEDHILRHRCPAGVCRL
jgi:NADH:ubiquinone oxidoreductase subunit F (NADH-binding)